MVQTTRNIKEKSYNGYYEAFGLCNYAKLAHNTHITVTPFCVKIYHHGTQIIELDNSGFVILNNGGWYSVTTKQRMNQFSPLHVWQKDYTWYVTDHKNNKEYEYHNGRTYFVGGAKFYRGDIVRFYGHNLYPKSNYPSPAYGTIGEVVYEKIEGNKYLCVVVKGPYTDVTGKLQGEIGSVMPTYIQCQPENVYRV